MEQSRILEMLCVFVVVFWGISDQSTTHHLHLKKIQYTLKQLTNEPLTVLYQSCILNIQHSEIFLKAPYKFLENKLFTIWHRKNTRKNPSWLPMLISISFLVYFDQDLTRNCMRDPLWTSRFWPWPLPELNRQERTCLQWSGPICRGLASLQESAVVLAVCNCLGSLKLSG